MTPPGEPAGSSLGVRLAEEIGRTGPLRLDKFMAAASSHYYATRDPFGGHGDFTTAPEISQIFGEILGAWLADAWIRLGAPDPVLLVELGPGRGTLMADMLRALSVLPACRAAVRIHLVETSPVLREMQRRTLSPEIRPIWHDRFATVPAAPLLLVANEFFDALPIRQWQRRDGSWHERCVAADDAGELAFSLVPAAPPPLASLRGDWLELSEASTALAEAIGSRLSRHPGAALIVDYGHDGATHGDTLQALRGHRFAPVLADPGEADLTAHVDFGAIGAAFARSGATVRGPWSQGEFLRANGAELRAAQLARGRPPDEVTTIRRAAGRLLDPAQMGTLFKVLAVTSPADRDHAMTGTP